MNPFVFHARSLSDTDRFGADLAEVLPPGTTIALNGTLGAGKTRLVQAIAAACGIPRETVVSPTFVLCQEYHGSRTIYHLDAYRLKDDAEFQQLGPDEYFQSIGVTILEWAERVASSLPAKHLEINIEVGEAEDRHFKLVAHGTALEHVLKSLASRYPLREPD